MAKIFWPLHGASLNTSLSGQFQDIHTPDKLSDHDIVSGSLKVPPIKKPHRKLYLYQKGDYDSMRKNAFEPGHEKMCLMPYANNKGADQPAHPRSLINAFVVRCKDRMIPLVYISEISKF